jgi:hypothetical protein
MDLRIERYVCTHQKGGNRILTRYSGPKLVLSTSGCGIVLLMGQDTPQLARVLRGRAGGATRGWREPTTGMDDGPC